mmetsp:Transcript_36098/g.86481  ORF Transcript_36098/g.86481 Transcript_36098/m.86481 type:complete len:202 (-) Transcript_36098:191-796(-)
MSLQVDGRARPAAAVRRTGAKDFSLRAFLLVRQQLSLGEFLPAGLALNFAALAVLLHVWLQQLSIHAVAAELTGDDPHAAILLPVLLDHLFGNHLLALVTGRHGFACLLLAGLVGLWGIWGRLRLCLSSRLGGRVLGFSRIWIECLQLQRQGEVAQIRNGSKLAALPSCAPSELFTFPGRDLVVVLVWEESKVLLEGHDVG